MLTEAPEQFNPEGAIALPATPWEPQTLPDNPTDRTAAFHDIVLSFHERSIDRTTQPATLLHIDGRPEPIPFILIGDAQANNWFLYGDGNPREHQQISTVTQHLFTSIPTDLPSAVSQINDESSHQVLLDNTKIPGSFAKTLGRSASSNQLTLPTYRV